MTQPDKRVYVRAILNDGTEVSFLVENLGAGGALLMCPGILLHPDKRLDDCLLLLPDVGNIHVNVVVRWQVWPRVGVQFDQLSEEATAKISRFLAKAELVPA